jgi:hypothetical protein
MEGGALLQVPPLVHALLGCPLQLDRLRLLLDLPAAAPRSLLEPRPMPPAARTSVICTPCASTVSSPSSQRHAWASMAAALPCCP